MTMTLWQVRDWHKQVAAVNALNPKNLHAMRKHGEMADAIDAHMAGMGEPYGYLWQEKLSPKTKWKFTKEAPDAEDRKWNHIIPLYAAPPYNLAAVREVIAELRAIRTTAPVTWFGGLRLRVEIDKLEAVMPEEAK